MLEFRNELGETIPVTAERIYVVRNGKTIGVLDCTESKMIVSKYWDHMKGDDGDEIYQKIEF